MSFSCDKTKWFEIMIPALLGLFFLAVLFISSNRFIEAETLPKWYAFIAGALILTLVWSLFPRHFRISFDRLSVLIFVFIGYLLLWNAISFRGMMLVLSLVSFFLLYILFKTYSSRINRIIPYLIVAVCVLLSVQGIFQYLDIFYTSGAFAVKGSFDNPAGFAACLAAGFPFGFVLLEKKKKWVGISLLILIGLAVILSGSRAGILAIFIVSILYIMSRYFHLLRKKWIWIGSGLLLICLFIVFLFLLRKDSAVGRFLIWENTLAMIADKPILGHGPGAFPAEYMEYQAEYFKINPDSRYSQLADNVNYPFNEFLLLGIQYGLIGLLLLAIILFYIVKTAKTITPSHFCLLSIAVFACFSYPLRYPFVAVLLAYSLAMISRCDHIRHIRIKPVGRILLVVLTIVGSVFLMKDIRFESEWGNLVRLSRLGKTDEILPHYARLYDKWNRNPLFLYNYGALLNRAENYSLSNEILYQCEVYLNDYDVQMIMGENHRCLGQWQEAEKHYRLAYHMIPNRFMPLYRLMQMYDETGQKAQALEIAEIIVSKRVKVPSSAGSEIINQAKLLIYKNQVL